MRYTDTASVSLSRGAWLIACAGIPCGPVQPGACVDPDRWPWADGAATVGTGTGSQSVTQRVVPLLDTDLPEIRAAALAEVGRLGAARLDAPAVVDGVPYELDGDSRAQWGLLLIATYAATLAGAGPDVVFPVLFAAADGSPRTLTSAAEAGALYLALFATGNARRVAASVAATTVASAVDVAGVASALTAYQSVG